MSKKIKNKNSINSDEELLATLGEPTPGIKCDKCGKDIEEIGILLTTQGKNICKKCLGKQKQIGNHVKL